MLANANTWTGSDWHQLAAWLIWDLGAVAVPGGPRPSCIGCGRHRRLVGQPHLVILVGHRPDVRPVAAVVRGGEFEEPRWVGWACPLIGAGW